MSDPAKLYQVPHPSVFILEEMDARGWDRDILAWCMVLGTGERDEALARIGTGDTYDQQGRAWQRTRLALDLYFEIGADHPNMRLGEMAAQFSRAFGASEELFVNLETRWLQSDLPTGKA